MGRRWGLGIVLAATLLFYSCTLTFSFVTADDSGQVTENPFLASPEALLSTFTKPYLGLYMPLTYSAWAIARWFSEGLQLPPALVLHALGLLTHLVNVLLVYLLIERLTRHVVASALGAALFSFHPLQVEAVAWVSAYKDTLSATFALSACLLVLTRRHSLAFLAFLGAVLSKSTCLLLPLVALLLDYASAKSRPRVLALRYCGWFIVSALIAAIALGAQPARLASFSLTAMDRAILVLDGMGRYLFHLASPVDLSPATRAGVREVLQAPWGALLSGALLIFLTLRRRFGLTPVFYGATIWFLLLLPVLGVVPFFHLSLATTASRYHYLAMTVIAAGFAWLHWRNHLSLRAGIFFVALLTSVSVYGLMSWRSDIAFAVRAAEWKPTPSNLVRAAGLLAKAKREEEALPLYERAIQADPQDVTAANNLALLYSHKKEFQKAIALLQQIIDDNRATAAIYNNLGVMRATVGDTRGAAHDFEAATRLDPRHAEARANLRRIHETL